MLGTMLKIVELTLVHSQGRLFVRIRVELDLRKKLTPDFTTSGKDFRIEYEGLHMICLQCG